MAQGLRPGVHCIAATPFLPDESLDLASLDTLVDYLVRAGCDGILVLGVLGEADRLSDRERDAVIERTIASAGDRLQVSIGITHGSTVVTRERALAAANAGAAAVMISPPPGSAAGPVLKEHFKRIGADLTIPLIVQDHPTSSGVKLPVEFIAGLGELLPPASIVKAEDPPSAVKINKLREIAPSFQIFGGLGGVSLLQELEAGSSGAMTGFALADVLVGIVKAFQAGDKQEARELFEEALPLLVFEAQPGAGVGLRKEILTRRGAIAHPTVRQPASTPDAFTLRLLDDLLGTWPDVGR
jgi:4-hydroxy-tetrahydrodipicolinate synthase